MNIRETICSEREEGLLKLIACAGFYTDSYKKHINITNSTLKKAQDKGFILKNPPIVIYGKMTNIYTLTDKGIKFVKSNYLINPYRSRERQIEHDFILGEIYLMLSESERNTWKTETELELKYPEIVVVDGVYTDGRDGKLVGVEVITENYSKDMIKAKENFIKNKCNKGLVINTKNLK